MSNLVLGVVGDGGTTRVGGTTFYYNPKGGFSFGDNDKVTSTGPAQEAVVELIRRSNPDHFINLGDLVYNTGSSTTFDENVGRLYNDYMGAYPSPLYLKDQYLNIGPSKAQIGNTSWPFNIYDFPKGYPNPITGKLGGSEDGINRFWPTIGNHEYYLRTSKQGDTNISLHTKGSQIPDSEIKGQTSTPVPQPYVDYFPWHLNPELAKNESLKIGNADRSGHTGVYYKVSLGLDATNNPLVDLFSIDTMRLVMNRGGKYPTFTDGYGPATDNDPKTKEFETLSWNLQYDPTLKPGRSNRLFTAAANSNDRKNGWQQFNWLKSELQASKARWKIIIGHQPIYGSGSEDGQLDDNNNNPELQRFLNALPKNSFDAYMNGHSHFYQRVLEQNTSGPAIGLGIPFISIGSSGRKQDYANPSIYGRSTYEQPDFSYTDTKEKASYTGTDAFMRKKPIESGSITQSFIDKFSFLGNDINTKKPYYEVGFAPYLLASQPTTVGFSAGWSNQQKNWQDSNYGFGFGGATISAGPDYLSYHYETVDIPDPAIKDNLTPGKRLPALSGWDTLSANDWSPKDPVTGFVSANLDNTAMLELELETADQGRIKSVKVAQAGNGYMASHAGNHIVDFEIRGNDFVTGAAFNSLNPKDVAIARLSFASGKLTDAALINDGSGYVNLGQLLNSSNVFYATPRFEDSSAKKTFKVPIHYSFTSPLYGVTTKDYQDRYLITQTEAKARILAGASDTPLLEIEVVGKGEDAKKALTGLAQPAQWTTGYSGEGQQRGYDRAQRGTVTVRNSLGTTLVRDAQLNNGLAVVPLPFLPDDRKIEVQFGGDPLSSYLVNFKPSNTLITL